VDDVVSRRRRRHTTHGRRIVMHYVAQLPNSGPLEALLLFFLCGPWRNFTSLLSTLTGPKVTRAKKKLLRGGPSSGGGWGPVGTSSSSWIFAPILGSSQWRQTFLVSPAPCVSPVWIISTDAQSTELCVSVPTVFTRSCKDIFDVCSNNQKGERGGIIDSWIGAKVSFSF
jgi:hypothetical protein